MERQKFEESWKDAFEDAGVTPSESLWTNIELELEKSEGGKMKRRILFYKMLAAASVIFAMTFAGAGWYYMNKNEQAQQSLADQTNNATLAPDTNAKQNAAASSTTASQDNNIVTDNKNDTQKQAAQSPLIASENAEKKDAAAKTTETQHVAASNDKSSNANNVASEATAKKKDGGNNNDTALRDQHLAENSSALNKKNTNVAKNDRVVNKEGSESGNNSVITDKNGSNVVVASNNDGAKQSSVKDNGTAIVSEENSSAVFAANPNVADAKSPRPALTNLRKITPADLPIPREDPVAKMLEKLRERERQLAVEEKKDKKDKKSNGENLWTSVGFAAGSFTTAVSGATPPQSATGGALNADYAIKSNAMVQDQTRASGVSYSVGLNVGTRISDRWVIQGGVNYLNQSSDYSSHTALRDSKQNFMAASINELRSRDYERLVTVAEYDVNNSLQYLNIPLQAGYLIVNRKVGFQLNAGISTDLFIQNTITPEQGSFEKTTQGSGADSPYRTVNFSGLMGTELSYRFGQRYRVSLNPGLRYPFSSIYKSEMGIDATPLTFDVGLRFRYIFR